MSDESLALRDILTIADAVAEFGVSRIGLQKAIRRGVIRGRKVGRAHSMVWITTREAVAEYVARRDAEKGEAKARFGNMVKRRENAEKMRAYRARKKQEAEDAEWLAEREIDRLAGLRAREAARSPGGS